MPPVDSAYIGDEHGGRIPHSSQHRDGLASTADAEEVAALLRGTLRSSFDSQKLPLDPTVLATAMNGTAMGVPYKLPASTFMKDDPGTINACSGSRSERARRLNFDIFHCSSCVLEGGGTAIVIPA